ncbi:hypothetical protein GGS20DRAFT_580301 [Poronia punctata]|nr:hypothetical protein GGS20DRAFT_580301 [Poronia punctata]
MEEADNHLPSPDGHEQEEEEEEEFENPDLVIKEYLLERVPEFRRLQELRDKGWKNPAGDIYFNKQRTQSDRQKKANDKFFFNLMKNITSEIQSQTSFFALEKRPQSRTSILDMCAAPGVFLSEARNHNQGASIRGFSLCLHDGGHRFSVKSLQKTIEHLDINLLAADMGATATTTNMNHPEAGLFLPRKLDDDETFDMVLCDGQVLRTHPRAEYRERREAARLTMTQLALGLGHMREGGRMLLVMHKFEAWNSVKLLYLFRKFAHVVVLKPKTGHALRNSYYLLITNIRPQHPEARRAVQMWKDLWNAVTFVSDEEYVRLVRANEPDVHELLAEFGDDLVELGLGVWKTQADALANASFMS